MSTKKVKKFLKPHLWFTLYNLLNLKSGTNSLKISTPELSDIVGISQQSASRHLKILEQEGLITRRIGLDGSIIRITGKGMKALSDVYRNLKVILEKGEEEALVFTGVVFSGMYQGRYYIRQEVYRKQIREKLDFDPFPGTLNLRLIEADLEHRRKLDMLPAVVLEGFRDNDRAFGGARCYPSLINDKIKGALIIADRTSYDTSVIEIISHENLREYFDLKDGDKVKVSISNPRLSSS